MARKALCDLRVLCVACGEVGDLMNRGNAGNRGLRKETDESPLHSTLMFFVQRSEIPHGSGCVKTNERGTRGTRTRSGATVRKRAIRRF